MSLVIYFMSGEYNDSRQFANAFRDHQEWGDGRHYMWDGRNTLPSSAERVAEMEWPEGHKVYYTRHGQWPNSLGPREERSTALVDAILAKLEETGQFPDKLVQFVKWVDSRITQPEGNPRFAPLFRVISWVPPESTTLEFPDSIASKVNKIGSIIGGRSDEETNAILAKFEAIRGYLGKDKLEVFATTARRGISIPAVQAVASGRIVIGGQVGTVPGTERIFLPFSSFLWDNLEVGAIVGGERRSATLGGIPFCEVSSNTIWLLPRMSSSREGGCLSYCLDGIIAFLSNAWEAFEAAYQTDSAAGASLAWQETFVTMGPNLLQHMEQQLERSSQQVVQFEQQIEASMREVTMYSLGLQSLQGSEEQWREKGRQEYLEVSQNPNIETISFDGRTIKFTTKHLHMLHPATEKYHDLGVMRVEFIPVNGSSSVRVWNERTIGYVDSVGTSVHPHIGSQGDRGCQGTLSGRLATLFGQGAYADAVQLLIFFLTTVNYDDSAGRTIDRWPLSNGTYGDVTYNQGDIVEAQRT